MLVLLLLCSIHEVIEGVRGHVSLPEESRGTKVSKSRTRTLLDVNLCPFAVVGGLVLSVFLLFHSAKVLSEIEL